MGDTMKRPLRYMDTGKTAPGAASTRSVSSLVSVETLLQFSGAALALIAVVGAPAATLQHARLGVPLHLLTRDELLRAGVLAAVPLAACLFLSYRTVECMKRSSKLYWAGYLMISLFGAASVVVSMAIILAALTSLTSEVWLTDYLIGLRSLTRTRCRGYFVVPFFGTAQAVP